MPGGALEVQWSMEGGETEWQGWTIGGVNNGEAKYFVIFGIRWILYVPWWLLYVNSLFQCPQCQIHWSSHQQLIH